MTSVVRHTSTTPRGGEYVPIPVEGCTGSSAASPSETCATMGSHAEKLVAEDEMVAMLADAGRGAGAERASALVPGR